MSCVGEREGEREIPDVQRPSVVGLGRRETNHPSLRIVQPHAVLASSPFCSLLTFAFFPPTTKPPSPKKSTGWWTRTSLTTWWRRCSADRERGQRGAASVEKAPLAATVGVQCNSEIDSLYFLRPPFAAAHTHPIHLINNTHTHPLFLSLPPLLTRMLCNIRVLSHTQHVLCGFLRLGPGEEGWCEKCTFGGGVHTARVACLLVCRCCCCCTG